MFFRPLRKLPLQVLKRKSTSSSFAEPLWQHERLKTSPRNRCRFRVSPPKRWALPCPPGGRKVLFGKRKGSTLSSSGPAAGVAFRFKRTAERRVHGIVYLPEDDRRELWPGAQTAYPCKTHFTDCWQKQPTQIKPPRLTIFYFLLLLLKKYEIKFF